MNSKPPEDGLALSGYITQDTRLLQFMSRHYDSNIYIYIHTVDSSSEKVHILVESVTFTYA